MNINHLEIMDMGFDIEFDEKEGNYIYLRKENIKFGAFANITASEVAETFESERLLRDAAIKAHNEEVKKQKEITHKREILRRWER